ncbi:MAG: hypothetical protein AAF735_01105 [Myxococcota bacterium]
MTKRRWLLAFTLLVLPAMLATIPTYVGVTHNAMQEFCANDPEDPRGCILDVSQVSALFLAWFLVGFVLCSLAAGSAALILRFGRSR